jgi:hypothetical protein
MSKKSESVFHERKSSSLFKLLKLLIESFIKVPIRFSNPLDELPKSEHFSTTGNRFDYSVAHLNNFQLTARSSFMLQRYRIQLNYVLKQSADLITSWWTVHHHRNLIRFKSFRFLPVWFQVLGFWSVWIRRFYLLLLSHLSIYLNII